MKMTISESLAAFWLGLADQNIKITSVRLTPGNNVEFEIEDPPLWEGDNLWTEVHDNAWDDLHGY